MHPMITLILTCPRCCLGISTPKYSFSSGVLIIIINDFFIGTALNSKTQCRTDKGQGKSNKYFNSFRVLQGSRITSISFRGSTLNISYHVDTKSASQRTAKVSKKVDSTSTVDLVKNPDPLPLHSTFIVGDSLTIVQSVSLM